MSEITVQDQAAIIAEAKRQQDEETRKAEASKPKCRRCEQAKELNEKGYCPECFTHLPYWPLVILVAMSLQACETAPHRRRHGAYPTQAEIESVFEREPSYMEAYQR